MEVKEFQPRVTFNIGVPCKEQLDYIYITGDIKELGEWNPKKALRIKKSKAGNFNKTLKLPIGTKFEYKIIAYEDFMGVEKGRYFEELENRLGEVTDPKTKIIVEVKAFRTIENQ